MNLKAYFTIAVISFVLFFSQTPFAQEVDIVVPEEGRTARPAGGEQMRISRPMIGIDSTTLQADGRRISLWGVAPARSSEGVLELKALDTIDSLIGSAPVNCRIMKWDIEMPTARCMSHTNQDIAIVLLEKGLVTVDRGQTYNSVFASGYAAAQDKARMEERGVWKLFAESDYDSFLPQWLQAWLPTLIPLSLVLGPLVGFAIVSFMVRHGLADIKYLHDRQYKQTLHNEQTLQYRERMVLLNAFQFELEENIAKIEAFLTIYRDMMNDLRNPDLKPKYQDGGDLLHERPALQRTVFETNLDRLSLLEMKIASELSKLYTQIVAKPQFITLEPMMARTEVIEMIADVIRKAEVLKPQLEKTVADIIEYYNEKPPMLTEFDRA